uniref:Glycosyl transferase family 1 domain-containing protein n=1 Tax=Physcomitrium patens TaxID=3218 RepID=A0A7I4DYU7_PHYPA
MYIGEHVGVETSSNSRSSSIDNRDSTPAASEDSTCPKSEKKEEFTLQLKASPKTGHAVASRWTIQSKHSQNRASGDHNAVRYSLLWMAPFFSGGGYCSEAISYVTAVNAGSKGTSKVPKLGISHYADAENLNFWKGLPSATRQSLFSLTSVPIDLAGAVVVCHSEPGAWYPPLYLTPPCPPTGYDDPLYIIGRTMFETDGVTPDHVRRCNRMDEVWVPTQFHVDSFIRAGVAEEKLLKVVQPVDTVFFNPAHLQPLKLLTSNRLFGSTPNSPSKPFVFLSIFKWEYRKGWDILLSAYLQEFSADDNVALYLLTNPYHTNHDFGTVITEFVSSHSIPKPPSGWPNVYLHDQHIAQSQLPALYAAADCFVLPSRGEGWGRPHVEAMAMELPVIATNWSEEAKRKGKVARLDMVANYAQEVVARIVVEHLVRIQAKLDSGTSFNTSTSTVTTG